MEVHSLSGSFHTGSFADLTVTGSLLTLSGSFLGSTADPWDGSKLINLPGGEGVVKETFLNDRYTQTTNSTFYPLLQGNIGAVSAATANMRMPAGTFKNFVVNVYSNGHSGPPYDSVTLMKNSVATALTVSIDPAGATG